MYHTELAKREIKYSVVRKEFKIKFTDNNSVRGKNIIWINLYQGIGACTIHDIITFVKKELIHFYIEENLRELPIRERRKKLTNELNCIFLRTLFLENTLLHISP